MHVWRVAVVPAQDFKGADAVMVDLDGASTADNFTVDVLRRLPFDRVFDDRVVTAGAAAAAGGGRSSWRR
jgi:hypothetical protein